MTEILLKLLIFSIMFLIYISKMFLQIKEKLLNILYILFVNDLDFLIYSFFINIVGKFLEKASKIVLK